VGQGIPANSLAAQGFQPFTGCQRLSSFLDVSRPIRALRFGDHDRAGTLLTTSVQCPAEVLSVDIGTEIEEQIAYWRARTGEYDDWRERCGEYDTGTELRDAWQTDIAQLHEWLTGADLPSHVLQLATGTGKRTPRTSQSVVVAPGSSPNVPIRPPGHKRLRIECRIEYLDADNLFGRKGQNMILPAVALEIPEVISVLPCLGDVPGPVVHRCAAAYQHRSMVVFGRKRNADFMAFVNGADDLGMVRQHFSPSRSVA
jgi:hypothetical protein